MTPDRIGARREGRAELRKIRSSSRCGNVRPSASWPSQPRVKAKQDTAVTHRGSVGGDGFLRRKSLPISPATIHPTSCWIFSNKQQHVHPPAAQNQEAHPHPILPTSSQNAIEFFEWVDRRNRACNQRRGGGRTAFPRVEMGWKWNRANRRASEACHLMPDYPKIWWSRAEPDFQG